MILELKPEFACVLGVAISSVLVHHGFMAGKVMQARKKYNIDFPALYANAENCKNEDNRKKFNCVQRAHQNSLENQPAFLTLLTLAGLKFPLTASLAGVVYLAGRVTYFQGYSTGRPESRMKGAFMYFGTLTLFGAVGKWMWELYKESRQ